MVVGSANPVWDARFELELDENDEVLRSPMLLIKYRYKACIREPLSALARRKRRGKPYTLNPNPYTPNPKPETRNPES